MIKKLLMTVIILIFLAIPFAATAQQDIYSNCEYEIIEDVKYFKLSSIASVHKLTLRWNDSEKSVNTSYKDKSIVFDTINDIVYVNNNKYNFGDIKLYKGYTYIPYKATTLFNESYAEYLLKDVNDNNDNGSKDQNTIYTTYTLDDTNVKYVSIKEVCVIHGYNYQWYYMNKYVEIKTDDSIYFILVPTSIIMKNDAIINSYRVKEENDVVYIEYDALSAFDLLKTKEPPKQEIPETPGSEFIPIRQFADSINATVRWDDKNFSAILTHQKTEYVFDINNKKIFVQGIEVKGYVFKFENGITHVNTSLEELFSKKTIIYEKKDTYDLLVIKGSSITVKTHYPLHNPERIVIDLLNAEQLQTTSAKGQYFSGIRLLNDANGIKRVVLDLNENCEYSLSSHEGYIEIKLKAKDITTDDLPNTDKGNDKPKDTVQNEDKTTKKKNEASIKLSIDKINITVNKYDNYIISRVSDPNRIVVFIPGAYTETEFLTAVEGSRYVKGIKTHDNDTGLYIEIELTSQCRYEIIKKSKTELVLDIYSQKVTNLSYYNFSDRKYIMITGMSLADKLGKVNSNVKVESNSLITNISFIDTNYRLTAGVLYVNDDYIEKIQVKRTNEQVCITIYAKKPMDYYFNSEKSSYTNINLMPKNNEYEHCVVIDPGHGGYDPGAVAGSVYESNLNLSVAIKVEEILKSNGIKVFMIRKTDEYVGLYERGHIANNLAASLFVSIHSNAFANAGYKGIMTLVYPSRPQNKQLSGKSLGTTIQKNLISITQAIDRGVIDRPNLVVLKSTKMPAALVECGFMTNAEELAALQTQEYQDLLANGIAKGIIESLSMN